MAIKRALVAGTTSVFAEISGFDQLEVTVGGVISSSGALVLKAANNIVSIPATETLDVATIDRQSAAGITIGGVNTTSIDIGRVGQMTTILGDLTVDGAETVTGLSTFEGDALFEGNIQFGDSALDTVDFGGWGGVTATGNPTWNFGTGQADFDGNVDANAGLDVTGNITVTGVISGTDDGTGVVLGHLPTANTTGSAPQMVTVTNDTVRDYLVEANGMIVYNAGSSAMQMYVNGSWQTISSSVPSGWTDDGGVVRLTTAADDVAIGTAAMLGTEKLRVIGDVGIQGDIDFETGATRTVEVIQAASQTAGNQLSLAGGAGGDTGGTGAGGGGGKLNERGGLGGAGSAIQSAGAGGIVDVRGGDAGAANGGNGGNGGTVLMLGGNATGVRSGGGVTIQGGNGAGAITGSGGIVSITSGFSPGTAVGPELRLTGGSANSGDGGNVRIRPGSTSTGTAGSVVVGDINTLDVQLGAAATPVVVNGVLQGPNDGTGVVIGHAPVGANTGSTLQLASLTTVEKGNLVTGVTSEGMLVWDNTSNQFQWYDGTSWNQVGTAGSAGGWTDDGAVVRLTTSGDTVAIGSNTMLGSEKLLVVGDIVIDAGGDLRWDYHSGERRIFPDAAPAETVGEALSSHGGAGGAAGVGAGQSGGYNNHSGGVGGAGTALLAAGSGGSTLVGGGAAGAANGGAGAAGGNATFRGGASSGSGVGGNVGLTGGASAGVGASGGVTIDAGAPGAAAVGAINIGIVNAVDVNIGQPAHGVDVTISILDNTTPFTVKEGANEYINIDTTNGAELFVLGTASLAALHTVVLGNKFSMGSGANPIQVAMDLPDNDGSAMRIIGGGQQYVGIDTTTGTEVMSLGNTTDNPAFDFLGTGTVTLKGTGQKLELEADGWIGFDERTTDPTTAVDEGGLYTKAAGGVTQLFYREENSGFIHQITPSASSNPEYVGTAGENIDAGEAVNVSWDVGNSEARVYKCDGTSAGTLSNAVGIATTTSTTGNSVTVQLTGESIVIPDAQWDAVPANTRAGQAIYMSTTTNGNLTYTLPTGNVTVQQVGNLSIGGTGVCKILINVMVQLKKAA